MVLGRDVDERGGLLRARNPYELRLLRIPALYVMALWLHSPTDDLLVPLEPSPIGKEGKPVPTADFLAEISDLARNTTAPPA